MSQPKRKPAPQPLDREVIERIASEQIRLLPVSELRAANRNPRTHPEAQLKTIEGSIRQFGWTNPLLIDEAGVLIAGHGRLEAAVRMGLDRVPTIILRGLSEDQKQAYLIADNQIALGSGWDSKMLAEMLLNLNESGFASSSLGFSNSELTKLFDHAKGLDSTLYTRKIETPDYKPKGETPKVSDLVDRTKQAELLEKINASELGKKEKDFLVAASHRHVVFDYHAIAEYYCSASPEMQRLMEDSALVIIDIDKAIANGYVDLSRKLEDIYLQSYGDEDNDAA